MDIKLFRRRSFFRPQKMQDITSTSSQSVNESQLINTLHNYYFNHTETDNKTDSLYTKESYSSDTIQKENPDYEITNVEKIVLKQPLKPIPPTVNVSSNVSVPNTNKICVTENFVCNICENKNTKADKFIILSCNHIFHISCLAESHLEDVYKYDVIDNEYFASRKCSECSEKLQSSEILFLHSKFLSETKNKINNHASSIEELENKLKILKEELKVCYNYKHRLEQEREKSKQIITTLAYYQS